MPWKPIADELVVANLGGKVRQLVVTAENSDTGAVQVDWPPPVVVSLIITRPRGRRNSKARSMNRSTPSPSEPPPRASAPTRYAPGSGDQTASPLLVADRPVTDSRNTPAAVDRRSRWLAQDGVRVSVLIAFGQWVSFRFGPLSVSEGALSTNPSLWRGPSSSVPQQPNGVGSRLAGRSTPVGSLGSYGRPTNCTRSQFRFYRLSCPTAHLGGVW